MLTVYGDCSGSEQRHRATVVACFLNSAKGWNEFSLQWASLLTRYDVPYLHMSEFAQSQGPFRKWKNDEKVRRGFMNGALRIIEETGSISFAVAVDSDAFNREERRLRPKRTSFGNAYLLAAQACLASVSVWCKNRRMNEPTEYIFEKGDSKQHLLRILMSRYGLPDPIFRTKVSDDPQRSVVPLQAADLLAYELLKGYREIGKRPLRYPLVELERMTHDWGIYEEDNVHRLIPIDETVRALEAAAKGPG